jgi:hypothetical protein
MEWSVFELINQYRQSLRLPALVMDARLNGMARAHSASMAARNGPVSHAGFESRIAASGLPYLRAAENVASNEGFDDPAGAAVSRWLSRDEHRGNIEGEYDLTGIGIARSRRGAFYFTQVFVKIEGDPAENEIGGYPRRSLKDGPLAGISSKKSTALRRWGMTIEPPTTRPTEKISGNSS